MLGIRNRYHGGKLDLPVRWQADSGRKRNGRGIAVKEKQ
jgi:hypothetical protein